MLEIAVCCDRVSGLEYLYGMVEEYRMGNMDLVVRCSRFQSLYDLLVRVREGWRAGIYIVDHRHDGWMGELTPEALLRREDPRGAIVGFTAEAGEAFPPSRPQRQDTLRLSARMLRPVAAGPLGQTLAEIVDERYPEQRGEDRRLIFPITRERLLPPFRWEDRCVRVPYANIASLSYRSHGFALRLINGDLLRSSSTLLRLEELAGELAEEPGFLPVSRSALVNMDWVAGLDETLGVVRMAGGDELPVTRTGWEETAARLEDYLQKKRPPFFSLEEK